MIVKISLLERENKALFDKNRMVNDLLDNKQHISYKVQ